MEGYYNNMFQQSSSSRRGSSAIDRFTDPGTVTSYLCGYSLRVCTLYLLWIHFVFDMFVLVVMIIGTTYISINFNVVQEPNATLYTVTANKNKIFDIDLYSKDWDGILTLFMEKLIQIFYSYVILDAFVAVVALCGVYLDKLLLIVPYVVPIFTNILLFCIMMMAETFVIMTGRMSGSWVAILCIFIFLLKDLYRFTVLYSYFHMIGKHYFAPKARTPQYLTTQSPHHHHTPIDLTTKTTTMATTTTAPLVVSSQESPSSHHLSDDNDIISITDI